MRALSFQGLPFSRSHSELEGACFGHSVSEKKQPVKTLGWHCNSKSITQRNTLYKRSPVLSAIKTGKNESKRNQEDVDFSINYLLNSSQSTFAKSTLVKMQAAADFMGECKVGPWLGMVAPGR